MGHDAPSSEDDECVIDSAFAAMAHDEEYRAEARVIGQQFASADAEALDSIEQEYRAER